MDEGYIGPSDKEPSAVRTAKYQGLVRSLAFISCITRPNVAKLHLILSQHLQNPS